MAYLHTHLGEDGDDEAGSDAHGDGASTTGETLPSFAPSQADGMPGGLGDLDDLRDFLYKPQWDDGSLCSGGAWDTETRSVGDGWDGDDDLPGTWGPFSANWGGHWKDDKLQRHVNIDLRIHPCQVICLQEAEESLFEYLKPDFDADAQRADGRAGGKGAPQGGWEGWI